MPGTFGADTIPAHPAMMPPIHNSKCATTNCTMFGLHIPGRVLAKSRILNVKIGIQLLKIPNALRLIFGYRELKVHRLCIFKINKQAIPAFALFYLHDI